MSTTSSKRHRQSPILPGATIGILGSGQLGRMLGIAAREMGYRVRVYSPESDSPTGHIADLEIVAAYEDLDRVREFSRELDVLTYEFENVPSSTIDAATAFTDVRPGGQVLHVTQHRVREKEFLSALGIPVAPFRAVNSLQDLEIAAAQIGYPSILKTARMGYDGKGQVRLRSAAELAPAVESLRGAEGILEGFVDFSAEASVIVARRGNGSMSAFPVFENRHANHILDITFAPASMEPRLFTQAIEMATAIAEALQVVGLLTVELFVTWGGTLLVNELAPRTHNSGHLTLDAGITSQFEQQIRAICDLPLGAVDLRRPAAMANLLGELWANGEPHWAQALEDPDIKLHLYGKVAARPGRKMGHLTAPGLSASEAVAKVERARQRLAGVDRKFQLPHE